MSLIKCPECGKEISSKASSCPNCGCPSDEWMNIESEEADKIEPENSARCQYCGAEIVKGLDYCPECGSRLTEYKKIENTQSKKTSKEDSIFLKIAKNPFTILLFCLFLPPAGIFFLWFHGKPKNKVIRIIFTVLLVFYALLLYVPSGRESDKKEDEKQIEENADEQENNAEHNDDNNAAEESVTTSFSDRLKETLDETVAESACDILENQIGFSSLVFDSKMDDTDNYKIEADGKEIVMTASDKVYRIFMPNTEYVFYEDDSVKMTAKEYADRNIDYSSMISYYTMAETIIKGFLKNPSSAKFPSINTEVGSISMERNGALVVVQSYVDAKNSFNAKVRSNWTVEFIVYDLKSFSYEPVFIEIDGEKSGDFIDLDDWEQP